MKRKPKKIVNIFPKGLRSYIKQSALALNCNEEFIAVSILVAISTAIGNGSKIKLKEGWLESAILFLVIVGEPGVKKSPAINTGIAPINNIQDSYDAKGNSQFKTLITTGFTMPGLMRLLKTNNHGIVCLKDEFYGFLKQLTKNSKADEMENLLSLFNQERIVLNYAIAKPTIIRDPCVSILGGIQNDLIGEVTSMKENGFIDRFLWCYPEPVPCKHTEEEIDLEDADLYNNMILFIYAMQDSNNPKILPLSSDAKKVWTDWHIEYCDKMNDKGLPYFEKSARAKMEAYVGRFALILEWLSCSEFYVKPNEISPEAIQGAIDLSEIFLNDMRKVRNSFAASSTEKRVAQALNWMTRKGQRSFFIREFYSNKVASTYTKETALDLLEELRAKGIGQTYKTKTSAGRDTVKFMLNDEYYQKGNGVNKNQTV